MAAKYFASLATLLFALLPCGRVLEALDVYGSCDQVDLLRSRVEMVRYLSDEVPARHIGYEYWAFNRGEEGAYVSVAVCGSQNSCNRLPVGWLYIPPHGVRYVGIAYNVDCCAPFNWHLCYRVWRPEIALRLKRERDPVPAHF